MAAITICSDFGANLWEVSDGQGSLACCGPWGRKESDMTELTDTTSTMVFPGGSNGKESACNAEIWILDTVTEKAMAPHSSTLAWQIPWTEESGRLQSMGSLGVGHD